MIMAKMPGLYSTRSSEERAHEESESMVTAVSWFSELVSTLIKVIHLLIILPN